MGGILTDFARGLLNGMVWETTVGSFTGNYLYSDFAITEIGNKQLEKDSDLNKLVKKPFIGVVGGVARVGLGIIHTTLHLLAATVTFKKGHLFHASKGGCEILRGIIESIPIGGRIFANFYGFDARNKSADSEGERNWWIIKIYNPENPDGLDRFMRNWKNFPSKFYLK